MKRADIKEYVRLKNALRVASEIREFPNGKKLSIYKSGMLNQMGKLMGNMVVVLCRIERGEQDGELVDFFFNAVKELSRILEKE